MVQDSWNVDDIFTKLSTAENEIIILCAVIFRVKPFHLLKYRSFYYKEMTDVVVGTEKIQVKVRFEMRLEMLG